jgi:hypothetical protein
MRIHADPDPKHCSAQRGVDLFPSNLIEYLREFESICKTILAHEKTEGRKSRETVPLSTLSLSSGKEYLATVIEASLGKLLTGSYTCGISP